MVDDNLVETPVQLVGAVGDLDNKLIDCLQSADVTILIYSAR